MVSGDIVSIAEPMHWEASEAVSSCPPEGWQACSGGCKICKAAVGCMTAVEMEFLFLLACICCGCCSSQENKPASALLNLQIVNNFPTCIWVFVIMHPSDLQILSIRLDWPMRFLRSWSQSVSLVARAGWISIVQGLLPWPWWSVKKSYW